MANVTATEWLEVTFVSTTGLVIAVGPPSTVTLST